MAFFLVHDSTGGTASARPVLRWGECPAADIAGQATQAGEVAVELANLDAFAGVGSAAGAGDFATAADHFYSYNTSTGAITPVTPAGNTDYLAEQVRARAQFLLNETAWTQTIEGAFSDTRVQDWLTYRKAIREVAGQPGFPTSITWPTPPSTTEDEADPLWIKVYRRGNIIGPVSKEGLLNRPTGALIEEGANANGRYRRLAGGIGTQFCWHRLGSSTSTDVTWTFPAGFAGDNLSVTVTPVTASGLVIMAPIVRPVTATDVAFSIVNASATRIARTCELFAIGQWT